MVKLKSGASLSLSTVSSDPTSKTIVAALKAMPLFAAVEDASLNQLAARSNLVTIQAGRLVLDFEDETTDVLFVLEGRIRVLIHPVNGGHPRIFGDFHAGQYVGELAAIDGKPRSAQVQALTRSSLCTIPAPAFLAIAAEYPSVSLQIMRLLAARVRSLSQALVQHTTLPARLRIAAELLRVSRPREDGKLMIRPMPVQQDLADRVGCARETVSREIKALVAQGFLQRSNTDMIINRPDTIYDLVK